MQCLDQSTRPEVTQEVPPLLEEYDVEDQPQVRKTTPDPTLAQCVEEDLSSRGTGLPIVFVS